MDQEKHLTAAQSLQTLFDATNLNLGLVRNVADFNAHKLDKEDGDVSDVEDIEAKDPAIISSDVEAQTTYLRKLKYQYLEQNAKDKYVKSIVSDIDDAPIVTDDDNKRLELENIERKAKLKAAKTKLKEVQGDFKTLAPMVKDDYERVKLATAKATDLAQKIIDARLALSRLRQTHPHPRLTVETADKKLHDMTVEMQDLSDEIEIVGKKVQDVKNQVKTETLEVEALRSQRAEVEKSVKVSTVLDDDRRLVPLYDWYIASLGLERSVQGLEDMQCISENELHIRHRVENAQGQTNTVTIALIFVPNTRQLAAVNVNGLEESGVNFDEVIAGHLQTNNVRGVVASILEHARRGV